MYNDGKVKECGNCHKVKLYTEFGLKGRGLRSICKECKKNQDALEFFRNKFLIVINLTNKQQNGKCVKCNTNFIVLPVLDFHHTKPELKKTTWRKNRRKNWKNLLDLFEKEKVIILCKNCHSSENTEIFNEYKEVILKDNLFEFNAEVINKLAHEYVKTNKTKNIKNYKFRVIEWIKKRSVIDQLYNGKCIGCENVTVMNNLPALDIHHRNEHQSKRKKLRWNQIKKLDIKSISEKLINEDCICLCSNCHTLFHSIKYKEFGEKIIGRKFKEQIAKIYKNLENKIVSFEYRTTEIKDPLELLFRQGDFWKKYILYIYKLSQLKKDSLIKPLELKEKLQVTKKSVNQWVLKLESLGLIKILLQDSERFLKLTKKSKIEIGDILREKEFLKYYEEF